MWRRLLAWCARHPPVKSVDDTRADAVRVLTRDFTPEVRGRVTAATICAMDAAAACVAEPERSSTLLALDRLTLEGRRF